MPHWLAGCTLRAYHASRARVQSMGHGSTPCPIDTCQWGMGLPPCPNDTCQLEHKSIGHATPVCALRASIWHHLAARNLRDVLKFTKKSSSLQKRDYAFFTQGGVRENGRLRCRFTRTKRPEGPDLTFDLDDDYYFLVAKGNLLDDRGKRRGCLIFAKERWQEGCAHKF